MTFFGDKNIYYFDGTCDFVIPLILFIASAVMHGLAMKSGQFTKTLAIMPGLALIFSAGGLLLCQAIIKSKIKDAMSTLADVSGIYLVSLETL